MKKLIVCVSLLCSLSLTQAQNQETKVVSKEVAQIAIDMAQAGRYWDTAWSTLGLKIIEQYDRYLTLSEIASNDELVLLCRMPSPVVKAYAFRILAERYDPVVFNILLEHLHDKSLLKLGELENYSFDSYTDYYLGDFFYSSLLDYSTAFVEGETLSWIFTVYGINLLYTFENTYFVKPFKGYRLTQAELDYITFQLLYDSNVELYAKKHVLLHSKFEEEDYDQLRKLLVESNTPEAAVPLAKFELQEDLPLFTALLESNIKEDKFYGLLAARNFKHETLFDKIEEIHLTKFQNEKIDTGWVDAVYEVLFAYKTPRSKELLHFSLDNLNTAIEDYHLKKIKWANYYDKGRYFEEVLSSFKKYKLRLKP